MRTLLFSPKISWWVLFFSSFLPRLDTWLPRARNSTVTLTLTTNLNIVTSPPIPDVLLETQVQVDWKSLRNPTETTIYGWRDQRAKGKQPRRAWLFGHPSYTHWTVEAWFDAYSEARSPIGHCLDSEHWQNLFSGWLCRHSSKVWTRKPLVQSRKRWRCALFSGSFFPGARDFILNGGEFYNVGGNLTIQRTGK